MAQSITATAPRMTASTPNTRLPNATAIITGFPANTGPSLVAANQTGTTTMPSPTTNQSTPKPGRGRVGCCSTGGV